MGNFMKKEKEFDDYFEEEDREMEERENETPEQA